MEEREEESHFRIVWSPDSILFRREGGGAGERSGISSHSNTHSLSVALPPYALLYVHTFKCILPFLDRFFPSLEENNNNCCQIRRQRKLDGKKKRERLRPKPHKVVIDFLLGCMKNNDVKPGGKRGGREGGEAKLPNPPAHKVSLSLFSNRERTTHSIPSAAAAAWFHSALQPKPSSTQTTDHGNCCRNSNLFFLLLSPSFPLPSQSSYEQLERLAVTETKVRWKFDTASKHLQQKRQTFAAAIREIVRCLFAQI